ncbi:MAG: O-antigen ligase family protein [Limisphaerales bacterium]
MPPQLALLLWAGFVAFLFWREARQPSHVSRALWIPLIWVLIVGSRFVSQWLGVWGILPGGVGMSQEGSPLDAAVFLLLIVAGFEVLRRRRVRLATLMRNNVWLSVFFFFCLLSIAWSDEPFTAAKRWIKALGNPIMALVVLTDPDPDEALRRLFKRAAYVLLTGSVLCIKYFPHIGRGFDGWTGQAFNQGVNLNKNELGYVCMLTGLFFVWNFLSARHFPDPRKRREERLISAGFLGIIWWLLSMANSMTSLVCVAVGTAMMLVLGAKWISKRFLGTYLVAAALVFGIAEYTFHLQDNILRMLGRDPTLTDRTEVWADALALVEDPILGTGFESFWLGERLEKMWAKWAWQPIQAHNGYIELYLNLGIVGVLLFLVLVITSFKKIQQVLLWDFEYGRLRMGFLMAILFYNLTEAALKGVSLVWLVWHLTLMDYPRRLTAAYGPGSLHDEEAAEPPLQPGSASSHA